MIPILDIFAGPGGLGEGFAAYRCGAADPAFRICLSIEKDEVAHQTLELRSFFRQFRPGRAPTDYYEHLRGNLSRDELLSRHPAEAEAARESAWHTTLGEEPATEVDGRIRHALDGAAAWVLIGGPPCQAYSLAGRSRNRGKKDYKPEADPKHFLYREYLRIIAEHWPPIFVMENVKGLLSAEVKDEPIFDQILRDLRRPAQALGLPEQDDLHYLIWPLSVPAECGDIDHDPLDFVVKSELHGIPQTRHRVILLGVRSDMGRLRPRILRSRKEPVSAWAVLKDLPRLRSGLSKGKDSPEAWAKAVKGAIESAWLNSLDAGQAAYVRQRIIRALENLHMPQNDMGNDRFVECQAAPGAYRSWFVDAALRGVCNHCARTHMEKDLHRYLFVSCFGKVWRRSPVLADFPTALLPAHDNIAEALNGGNFADRFRVQLACRPATTITSHIHKDGHYYIHPQPEQCRSLTVREAARLQTFPDNYFFCGSRTAQYTQVGNAVPPLLAHKIAGVVHDLLRRAGLAG